MSPAELNKLYPTLAYGATATQAADYIRVLCRLIGLGFHPDTPISDYVNTDGERSFPAHAAKVMQRSLERAKDTLGDAVYEIGMAEFHLMMAGK